MADTTDEQEAAHLRRRVLRLGALLFQLRYYMAAPDDIAAHLYRRDATTYVQLHGQRVRFARDGAEDWLDLETAIARCKTALATSGEL